MYRRTLTTMALLCSAVVIAAALPRIAFAQSALVGTWMLVSCDGPASGNSPLFCDNPSGSFNLDANGRYTLLITPRGRPKSAASAGISGTARANVPPEDYKAAAQGIVAQFGTWLVNESDKTLTRKILISP
jgi:Lipocalin-like domain